MILDGKVVAADIKQRLAREIGEALVEGKRAPKLMIISVGEDPASKVYVRNKLKAAAEVGIIANHFPMQADLVTTEYVKETISLFNKDPYLDGIMVQLPLPKHLNEREIIDAIDPEKDVDGLTTTNIGRLRSGQPGLYPCTAKGIIDLCKYYDIELDGKDVTIVGRSNIVGKPLADMMMAAGATVTQCHSHTLDVRFHTLPADIVVAAIGKPKFVGRGYIGYERVVIDVGINRDEDGRLCGDVDFDDVADYCSAITPVPGGVGPMTVAELMSNTVEAWRNNMKGS
jgi:methylenetetrahydrofolate dehydrogenase (NADP+)/methenyltetrahydrofolate cyclohydrolase